MDFFERGASSSELSSSESRKQNNISIYKYSYLNIHRGPWKLSWNICTQKWPWLNGRTSKWQQILIWFYTPVLPYLKMQVNSCTWLLVHSSSMANHFDKYDWCHVIINKIWPSPQLAHHSAKKKSQNWTFFIFTSAVDMLTYRTRCIQKAHVSRHTNRTSRVKGGTRTVFSHLLFLQLIFWLKIS